MRVMSENAISVGRKERKFQDSKQEIGTGRNLGDNLFRSDGRLVRINPYASLRGNTLGRE